MIMFERDIEKISPTECKGAFCKADGFDAVRIASDYSIVELRDLISAVRIQLEDKSESCEQQFAYNQLLMAQKVQGGFSNGN